MKHEGEIDALDLAVMKLAKLIKDTPAVHEECKLQIDLDSLQNRIIDLNKLLYKKAKEEPLTRVALSAIAYGIVGGAACKDLASSQSKILGAFQCLGVTRVCSDRGHFKDTFEMVKPLLEKFAGNYIQQVWDIIKDIVVKFLKFIKDNPERTKELIDYIIKSIEEGKDKKAIVQAALIFMNQYK